MKKIAVVGFGFMGLTHTINIINHRDLELVAIVNRDPGLIEKKLSSNAGNIQTGNLDSESIRNIKKFSDLDECIKSTEPDALVICVPTFLHYEMAKQAMLHDRHVFLEKPMCLDISQGNELIDLALKKNKIFMTGHVVRFMPPYRQLKKFVDTRELGDLKFLSLYRFSGRPDWGQWNEKSVMESSGGALFDLVIHDIDLANYLLGLPDIIDCTCLPGKLSKHDYVNAMWKYGQKNVHVSIEGGNIFHSNLPFHAGYLAQFEKAGVMYSTLRENTVTIANDENVREIVTDHATDGYKNELDYFAACIINNSQPVECMPASSLEAVKLCYRHLKN